MTEAQVRADAAPASTPARFDGHDPYSLFGIVQPAAGEPTMTPGPWLVDAAGFRHSGALGMLMEVGWGMCAFLARPGTSWAGTTSSMAVEFLPGTEWFEQGDAVTATELLFSDADGALVRGEVRSGTGELVAFGSLNNRFVRLPEPWEPQFDLPGIGPDPSLGLDDILRLDPIPTADGTVMTLRPAPWLGNIFGGVQGGVVMVLAELAASTALAGGLAEWEPTSMRADFHRPATAAEDLDVRATRIQAGRSMTLVEVVIAKPDGKRAVTATVSYSRKR